MMKMNTMTADDIHTSNCSDCFKFFTHIEAGVFKIDPILHENSGKKYFTIRYGTEETLVNFEARQSIRNTSNTRLVDYLCSLEDLADSAVQTFV